MDDVLSNQLNQRRFSGIIFVGKNAPLYRMRISKAGGVFLPVMLSGHIPGLAA